MNNKLKGKLNSERFKDTKRKRFIDTFRRQMRFGETLHWLGSGFIGYSSLKSIDVAKILRYRGTFNPVNLLLVRKYCEGSAIHSFDLRHQFH